MKQKPKGGKAKGIEPKAVKASPEVINSPPHLEVPTPCAVKQVKPVNFVKKPGTLSHKTRKAIQLVVENGVDPKEAMILTGCTKSVNSKTVSVFKAKAEKYSLQRPLMQKLATNAVKDALEGKEVRYDAVKIFSNGKKVKYQEVIVPSYTNKLAAAAMVHDRTDPLVRRSENLNVNVECSPVDLSKYRNR